MRLLQLSLFFAMFILILSCDKEEEIITPPAVIDETEEELAVSILTGSADFITDGCRIELNGSLSSSVVPSKIGFIVSHRRDPKIETDSLIEFTGSLDDENFSVFYDDYISNTNLYWRSYATIDTQDYYGEVEWYIDATDFSGWLWTYDFSVACSGSTKEIVITNDTGCSIQGYTQSLTLLGDNGLETIDLGPVSHLDTKLEISEDVVHATLCIVDPSDPDNCATTIRKPIPESSAIEASALSDAPIQIVESTGFKIGDYFYMCGGFSTGTIDFIDDFWRHDPMNDEWQKMPDFPGGPRAFMTSFVINGIGYVGSGGYRTINSDMVPFSDFYAFDPAQNEWTQIEDIPFPGFAGIGFALGDRGYVTNLANEEGGSNTLFQYDSQTNTWSDIGEVPIEFISSRNMAISHNGYAYILNARASNSTEVFRFDGNGNWEQLANISVGADDGVVVAFDNSLFVTTGRGMIGMVIYDLADHTHRHVCVSNELIRSEAVGYAHNNRITIIGGIKHNRTSTAFLESYDSVYRISLNE